MADKDVKLIIRAKNEASKAIDGVNASLDTLDKRQSSVGKSAANAGSLLSSLGDDFQRLKNEVAALGALSKVGTIVDTAAKSFARLEDDVAKTTAELSKYEAQLDSTKAAQTALNAKSAETKNVLKGELDLLKRLRSERAAANAQARSSDGIFARSSKSIGSGKLSGESLNAAVETQSSASASSAAARAKVDELNKAIAAQVKVVDLAKTSISSLGKELSANSKEQSRLSNEIENTNLSLSRSAANLDKGGKELAELRSISSQAAKSLGNVALSQEELAAATARANSELDKSQSRLNAASKYSNGNGGFVDPKTASALRSQRDEIAKTEAAWRVLEQEVKSAAIAMRSTVAPSEAQVQAFNQSRAAASAAKQEFISLRAGLAALGGSVRSSYQEFARSSGLIKEFAAETRRAANSVQESKSKFSLRGLFTPFYGESRQALSYMQRIRGELLSMAAAYTGFYGVVQQASGAVKAFQSLEAARSRLGVAFNQDDLQIEKEMQFLDAMARRLGISFETLSEQYSKFAVAGVKSDLNGEQVREIFTSVAEAGRVMKLGEADMQGVFKALEQMISKGKISAEELRGQLGDRLPGAFNLLSNALGITTADLDKMLEKGEVFADSSTMLKFAKELDRTFGPQLAKSLSSTTVKLGVFKNELYQAQLRFANGGFIDALNDALDELSRWFDSREGRDFFLSLGSAAGTLVTILATIPKNFDNILFAIRALVAFKLASVFLGIAKEAAGVGLTITNLSRGMQTAYTSMGRAAGSARGLATGLTLTNAASRAAAVGAGLFGAAMNAIPGVVLLTGLNVALSYLFTNWVGGVDDATSAMDEHQRVTQAVKAEYERLGKTTEGVAKEIKAITLIDAERNLIKQVELEEAALSDLEKQIKSTIIQARLYNNVNFTSSKDVDGLDVIVKKYRDGELSVKDFRKALADFNAETKDIGIKSQIQALDEFAIKAELQTQNVGAAGAAADAMGSTLTIVDEILKKTGVSMDDLTSASEDNKTGMDEASASARDYADALNFIKEQIPGLSDELKKVKELANLDAEYAKIQAMGPVTVAAQEAYQQAKNAISDKYTNFEAQYTATRGTPRGDELSRLIAAVTKLADEKGLIAKDILTAISYETGGTFDPRKKGPTTQYGQHQGLIQFGEPQAAQYGVTDFSDIERQVEAIGKYLTDTGVKAGDGLLQIYAAINAGNAKRINASDANNGGAPGTVLDKVSDQMDGHKAKAEALLASYGGVTTEIEKQLDADKKISEEKVKQAEKNVEEAKARAEATQKQKEDLDFQISQETLLADNKQRQAAIEDAIRSAKAANKDISQQELDLIAQKAGKLFDIQNAKAGEKAAAEAAKLAEEEVNRLLEYRTTLMEQLEIYRNNGDQGKFDSTKTELEGVNKELESAIGNARAFNDAIGGTESDLANAKLNTIALSMQDVGRKAVITSSQVFDLLGNSLVTLTNDLAKAFASSEDRVENIKNAFLNFASQFLIQLGQMIAKQLIFNAIAGLTGGASGGSGGGGGIIGSLFGAVFGKFHDGGRVSDGGSPALVDPSVFRGAMKLHAGGMPQLANNEVPAVLLKDEEVLTSEDPRHVNNGGKNAKGNSKQNVKIVNAIDAGSFISEGLNSRSGEESFMNFVRANSGAISSALGR